MIIDKVRDFKSLEPFYLTLVNPFSSIMPISFIPLFPVQIYICFPYDIKVFNMMDKPRRLFDAIAWQLQQFPKPDMLNAKERGVWKNYSTQQVAEIVNNLSAGLLQ